MLMRGEGIECTYMKGGWEGFTLYSKFLGIPIYLCSCKKLQISTMSGEIPQILHPGLIVWTNRADSIIYAGEVQGDYTKY